MCLLCVRVSTSRVSTCWFAAITQSRNHSSVRYFVHLCAWFLCNMCVSKLGYYFSNVVSWILQLWPHHVMERSMEESLIFLVCDCTGLICLCSAVCHSDIVIRFSSRGTFQALCWLLIGLKCNECVILMTQFQLIVIFMSCECSFFLYRPGWHRSLSGHVYVQKRECVDARNKGRSQRTASFQFILLCS